MLLACAQGRLPFSPGYKTGLGSQITLACGRTRPVILFENFVADQYVLGPSTWETSGRPDIGLPEWIPNPA
jgi:hypothetical protein